VEYKYFERQVLLGLLFFVNFQCSRKTPTVRILLEIKKNTVKGGGGGGKRSQGELLPEVYRGCTGRSKANNVKLKPKVAEVKNTAIRLPLVNFGSDC
jgi:hypothetical protein